MQVPKQLGPQQFVVAKIISLMMLPAPLFMLLCDLFLFVWMLSMIFFCCVATESGPFLSIPNWLEYLFPTRTVQLLSIPISMQ